MPRKCLTPSKGGAIICHDARTKQRIDYLKNFGFAGETRVVAPGINAKMNEMEAAFGLLQLKYIDGALAARSAIYQRYCEGLQGIPGISWFDAAGRFDWNHAYYPVLVGSDYSLTRDGLYDALKAEDLLAPLFLPAHQLLCHVSQFSDRFGGPFTGRQRDC